MEPAARDWNASSYQAGCSFVWELARDLLALAAPRAAERILDAGCGTGQLTAQIARTGARVTGIDNSPVCSLAAPRLLRDGVWTLDYRRLRVLAVRVE
jgi:2-polyprenyl-3-methyl-5-hydroxy-6-metoxy-1,4-benzoquinol methylase